MLAIEDQIPVALYVPTPGELRRALLKRLQTLKRHLGWPGTNPAPVVEVSREEDASRLIDDGPVRGRGQEGEEERAVVGWQTKIVDIGS